MKMLLFWKIQYTVYKSKSNAGFKNVMFEYLFFFFFLFLSYSFLSLF